VFFPKFRGDLVQTAVVVERMRAGAIESMRVPANPSTCSPSRSSPCAPSTTGPSTTCTRWCASGALRGAVPVGARVRPRHAVRALSESDEFAELRPRIVWDRVADTSRAPGAQRLAVTSGGTIPDRGLYAVFLASGDGPGRRVGELDEEMVYESRVGDVFTLGTSTWRIEDITHDQVLVTPAPGQPGQAAVLEGRHPRSPRRARAAVGAFVREIAGLPERSGPDPRRRRRPGRLGSRQPAGLPRRAAEATGHVPSDRTIVVERFRDELGDWRVVVHSPFGMPRCTPPGRWRSPPGCASVRRRRPGDGGDDGIVLRLPDWSSTTGRRSGLRSARC
jgi:ATP-dependent Lhr-like helicase